MGKDYTQYTLQELHQLKGECEAYAEIFKPCMDGSHGMALHHVGYYDVKREIEERTND